MGCGLNEIEKIDELQALISIQAHTALVNWLAHFLLSEPTPAFRFGNVLPDMLPPAALATLPADYQSGVICHRFIDRYTDSHPIVRRSIARLGPSHRRFGGVLMDIFYDHFLAVDWRHYSPISLQEFAHGVYDSLESQRGILPPDAYEKLSWMKKLDWLCSYREITGIRTALERIDSRLRRPVNLVSAMDELEVQYEPLRADFHEFFPQLQEAVEPMMQPQASA